MWLIDSHQTYSRSQSVFANACLSKASKSHWGWKGRCMQLFLLWLALCWSMPQTAWPQIVSTTTPQPEPTDFDHTVGMPPYVLRTYQFAADEPGKVRVETYLGVVNDILQFVKVDGEAADSSAAKIKAEGYRAQYEANLAIWDKQKNIVDSRNWKRDLFADNFDATNDRKKLNTERATFDLPPGEYEISLELTDRDTGKNLRDRRPLKLAQLPSESNKEKSELRLSSLVFIEAIPASRLSVASPSGADVLASFKASSRSALRDSLPFNFTAILMNMALGKNNLPNGVFEKKTAIIGPGAYFEIDGAVMGENLQLQYEIRDWRQQIVQEWKETIVVSQTPVCHLAFLEGKINQPGQHTLRLVAKSLEPAKHKEAMAEENFQVQISTEPNAAAQLSGNKNLLYEPLRYIIKGADYKRIAEAAEADRDSLVAEFWQGRDPDPATPANQLREEFYRRVAFADMRFVPAHHEKTGWETDRGRIYIKYGPPKEVHHQMAEQGAPPYEIWYYPDIDLYFVFRDKTGSGDFELVNR